MPELPDVLLYVESLRRLLVGERIEHLSLRSPFLLRTFEPALDEAVGRRVVDFSRRGKRIVWQLEGDLFLVFHLMIAGRFHWHTTRREARSKVDLLAIQLSNGTMMLTEASSKKRAGLWVFASMAQVDATDPGGLDISKCTMDEFKLRLTQENRTLKRALADPKWIDGIGNAYGDEILHGARLSPLKRTHQLSDEEWNRLLESARDTIVLWVDRLALENRGKFPEKVTAFRPQMAVHGKFGQSCPVCGAPVQRICYAENECNYCAGCQTGGRLLADRSLSRLLKDDWPKTLEDLEEV